MASQIQRIMTNQLTNHLITFEEAQSIGSTYYQQTYLPSQQLVHNGEVQTTSVTFSLAVLEAYLQYVKSQAVAQNIPLHELNIRVYQGQYPANFEGGIEGKLTNMLVPAQNSDILQNISVLNRGALIPPPVNVVDIILQS